MNEVYTAVNPPISWVKAKIEEAGSKIGNVWFIKRTDGSLRKMAYKLGVFNPKNVAKPKGEKLIEKGNNLTWRNTKFIDEKNLQMRVYDVNHVNEDYSRGAYRMINLPGVIRIASAGNIYLIQRK